LCRYLSCVVTNDFKAHWKKQSVDHESILDDLKLPDATLRNRTFVRIEITPETDPPTRKPEDWKLRVDEEGTLPEWFIEHRTKAETACWKAWEESVQIQLALNDEKKEVTDTLIYLYGSSSAVLYGSSRAELYDSSSAELYGSSSAVLYGSSRAVLKDSSSAELYGSSSAVLYDSSSAELYGSSSAVLYGSSRAVLYGSSSAELYGSSSAVLYDSSRAELYDSSRAELYDSSRAVLYGSSSAELYGSSRAELYDSSRAELKSTVSTAICNRKVIVHTKTTIIKKTNIKAEEL